MSSKVKRMSALTIACIAVALCVSLMAVGTYALFSETVTVSGHLQLGRMEERGVGKEWSEA
jgi:predicted ribosomally synthesized peptide with SipW-like signal peptide